MFENFSLFPDAASTMAGRVDAIYFFLIAVSVFFTGLIVLALVVFSLRYRRKRGHQPVDIHGSVKLEVFWTAIPLAIVLFVFGWSAKIFYDIRTPPEEGMEFLVTGKQWMWRVQHPTGQREINSLHIPVGQTIKLKMTSEDVIHDFFVPAFRVKADVVPGMYNQMWFEATKTGTYHLFCAEYCGTKHSQMIGQVVVMDTGDYEQWLSGRPAGLNPVESGTVLFENLRCNTCHAAGAEQRGPVLDGRFGKPAQLDGGRSVLFDEDYIRESIVNPSAKRSVGYEAIMPTYQGQVSEEDILHLIAYIKSLSTEEEGDAQQEGDGQ